MAQNQEFLQAAIAEENKGFLYNIDNPEEVALEGRGDGKINDIPALPLIENVALKEPESQFFTKIARARIAALIKFAGFCEMKNLVPIFPSNVYGGIVSKLLNNAQAVLSHIEEDPYWLKRSRVLELCHEEFLNDEMLDKLSVAQIIKLRSKTWGKQAEARESLFESIGEIAQEIESNTQFEEEAKSLIENYSKPAQELENERSDLSLRIKCDIGIGVLGGGSGLAGLLSQLQSPISSIGLTLAAGGIWALEKSKEYIPTLRKIKEQEQSLKRGAGFGLNNFYSRMKKG